MLPLIIEAMNEIINIMAKNNFSFHEFHAAMLF